MVQRMQQFGSNNFCLFNGCTKDQDGPLAFVVFARNTLLYQRSESVTGPLKLLYAIALLMLDLLTWRENDVLEELDRAVQLAAVKFLGIQPQLDISQVGQRRTHSHDLAGRDKGFEPCEQGL